ncbi:hypothetical protein IJT17_09960 [bacterium]|nr:hypothetical protein [bacterium]
MRKYPYMPYLLAASALAASLWVGLPAQADTAPADKASGAVAPSLAPPSPSANADSTESSAPEKASEEASDNTRTIQVKVPKDSSVTIKITPDGDTIITDDSSQTSAQIIKDYHKDWPAPPKPSFLHFPWPYIPDDFASRPQLGVIDLQSNAHGYPAAVKLNDESLTKDPRLVLQRSSVLSSRAVNKLNLDTQQLLLATPELTLNSRYAPTFFAVKNILLLHPQKNDVYSATFINLANLKGRKLYAPPSQDACSAHTYLVRQALLPAAEAQQNVTSDHGGKYYHCLGATDVDAKQIERVYDSPKQAEDMKLRPCPKCFEIDSDIPEDAAPQEADTAFQQDYDENSSSDAQAECPECAKEMADTAADSSAAKDTNASAKSAGAIDWKDSFLHRNYSKLPSQLTEAAPDDSSKSRKVTPASMGFATRNPLAVHHIYDKAFDDTYRHLLRRNGISDLKCAAFLISDSDCCAFPYYADGPIYVTRGLYQKLDTPGELAAALSRELAQVLLGYVDNRRTAYYNDPYRPWILSANTRRLIEESRLLYNWYSTMELLSYCGGAPYWCYTPIPMLGNATLSDYAYFELSDEQEEKTDRVAAVMCYTAGFAPSEYASYVNKINQMHKNSEHPNGDINMWLLSAGADKNRAAALQKTLQSLRELDKSVAEIAVSDPAMGNGLRAQAALYMTDPQKVTRFIEAYKSIVPQD